MILVTGGTGLVGAHLLLYLTGTGCAVRALYRTKDTIAKTKNVFTHFNKQDNFESIEWVQGDIIDIPSLEDAFKGITQVYHCAALISYDPADEEKLRKINIEGTANMVNCALAFGVEKFCHVSSVSALGDTRDGAGVITEETEWNPEKSRSDYAISKYGAEMEVWRGWQEGLNAVIVNPGLIFGYGFNNQGSGQLVGAIKKGQYFYTLGKSGIVAVEDVVKIMVQLMHEGNHAGERFTVISENMTLKKLFDTLADALGKKHPAYYATPGLTAIAWRIDWLISKLLMRKRKLSKAMAKASHNTETFDNSKVITTLNYTFTSSQVFLKQFS